MYSTTLPILAWLGLQRISRAWTQDGMPVCHRALIFKLDMFTLRISFAHIYNWLQLVCGNPDFLDLTFYSSSKFPHLCKVM